MPQSQALINNLIISGPTDLFIVGTLSVIGSGNRATLPLAPTKIEDETVRTSESLLQNEVAPALKDVENLWRERTKQLKEVKPVPFQTMLNAQEFLKKLSVHCSVLPEVESFPDGDITFEWSTDKGALSVLIDEKQIYYYSKSKSGKRRKGSDPWESMIPGEILDLIKDLIKK